jgi:hypothetical protein
MVLISKEPNQKYTLSLLPGAATDFSALVMIV